MPLFITLNAIELKQIEEPEIEKRLGEPYVKYRESPNVFPEDRKASP